MSHLDSQRTTAGALLADIDANASALGPAWGTPLVSFAYPFGRVTPRSARVLGERFMTCRGNRPGLNGRETDAANLRANVLYGGRFDTNAIGRLIEAAVSTNSWLVFYTHDIQDNPSPYGCTPGQFKQVVAMSARRTRILPVKEAAKLAAQATA